MRALAVLVGVAAAYAQAPSHVPFQCTEDDVAAIGQTCSNTEPCAVYLELSGLDVVGPKLFVTGNLHSDTATIASILLASADGGKTWTEPHPRIRSAGLDQIQFIDFEAGWISGQLLLGTPKDPFLLLTNDGGKTWRAQPIFEDTHPGTIEQFWFDSRTSGALLIDRVQASETGARHELLETMTGGESWIPRETSASPIRLKRVRPASPNPDWRLRADAASKSYRVEHQEAGRWTMIATFPVRIGECKAPESNLSDAPPDSGNGDAEPDKKAEDPAAPNKPPTLKKKKP
jgi:photosystem II stability/assembly factor-like uncharacterized protein